jgi:DnaJ-class molecular chaperone
MAKIKLYSHYEKLNIPKDATSNEIENAYKKLIIKYDPSKYEGSKRDQVTKIAKSITDSYSILSIIETRKAYDETLKDKSIEKENLRNHFLSVGKEILNSASSNRNERTHKTRTNLYSKKKIGIISVLISIVVLIILFYSYFSFYIDRYVGIFT